MFRSTIVQNIAVLAVGTRLGRPKIPTIGKRVAARYVMMASLISPHRGGEGSAVVYGPTPLWDQARGCRPSHPVGSKCSARYHAIMDQYKRSKPSFRARRSESHEDS